MGGAAAQPQCGVARSLAVKIRALQAAGHGGGRDVGDRIHVSRFSPTTPPDLGSASCVSHEVEWPKRGFMVANERHERIRELRRAGHSVGDIAERLKVSRQTVWRASKGIEPAPAPAPAPDLNGHVDLDAARRVGLDTLLDRASAGSVSAASTLFKQASEQLRADKCQNHISKDRVIKALHAQFDLWVAHLQGPFVRRLLLEYDLDPGQVEGLIDDEIDAVTRELNTRFAPEENTHA